MNQPLRKWGIWVSGILAAVTIVLLILLVLCHPNQLLFRTVGAFWGLWTVGPPLFFLSEWWLFKGEVDDPEFKSLDVSHDRASKFWLALVTAISAVILLAAGGTEKLTNAFFENPNNAASNTSK